MKEKDFHKLSDEEKNALAMGWKKHFEPPKGDRPGFHGWIDEDGNKYFHKELPKPLSDMNLCLGVVKAYQEENEHIFMLSILKHSSVASFHTETCLITGESDNTPQEAIIIACLKAEGVLED